MRSLPPAMLATPCGIAHCSRDDPACWRRTMQPLHGVSARVAPLDSLLSPSAGPRVRLIKLDAQGWECKALGGLARTLASDGRAAGATLVAELASGWLSAQCCGMRWLQHLMRVRPDWEVRCTAKAWAEATCVSFARGPASNASQLPSSVVGAEVVPQLSLTEREQLMRSMARCRRGDPNDVLPLERPCCPAANPEESLHTVGRCAARKARGLCVSQARAAWVRTYCKTDCAPPSRTVSFEYPCSDRSRPSPLISKP